MSAPTPNALRELAEQARDLLTHNPPCPMHRSKENGPPHLDQCGYPNLHTGQPNPLCLTCSYRWTFDAVSSKRVRDNVKTMAGSPGDPTFEFALQRLEDDKGKRRAIDRQLTAVKDAVSTLIAQERALNRLIESFTGRNGREERYPPGSMVSKAEMAESWEAKQRREKRGGGFGVG